MAESDVLSEIEVLESIYLDELLVNRKPDGDWEVSLVLYPSTAEDCVSQFVRLTLTLTLDQQYPSSSPHISIHNPRGLSDDKISSVQKCLQLEAQSCLGSPVLYQLIEKAKEILTESNIPHGNCVICLYGFKEGETFSKTSCYHYFHSHCLGRYVSHSEAELRLREEELQEDKTRERAAHQELAVVCPVCREPLTYDVDQLLRCPAPQLPELDGVAIGSTFQLKWRKLQKLLERQKSRGGIIDPEAESNRFLIHTTETPPAAENENLDAAASLGARVPPHGSSHDAGVRADQFVSGPSHCRGGPGHRRQNQARGPRRGGRSRPPHHRRAAPVAEHLDKLTLSSAGAEGPMKAPGPQPMHGHAELCRSNTGRGVPADHREAPGSAGHGEAPGSAEHREGPGSAGHRETPGSAGHREGAGSAGHQEAPGSAGHREGAGSAGHQEAPGSAGHREGPGSAGHQEAPGSAGHREGPGSAGHQEAPGSAGHREGAGSAGHQEAPGSARHREGPGSAEHREGQGSAEHQEAPGSAGGQGQAAWEAECPNAAAGPRGRRRGPHRPDSDPGARGRYHWDGRASKSRGGPGHLYGRGGGPRWGHGGGFQHKVVEREGRGEEVL